mgnify:CR=1 FL=1
MKSLLTALFITVSALGFAQSKNAKATLEVKGNCDRCKTRIEKASFSVKGVKTAQWDEATQRLNVLFDETKTTVEKIEDAVVAAGHDTANKKTSEDTYNQLHHCCKYERE